MTETKTKVSTQELVNKSPDINMRYFVGYSKSTGMPVFKTFDEFMKDFDSYDKVNAELKLGAAELQHIAANYKDNDLLSALSYLSYSKYSELDVAFDKLKPTPTDRTNILELDYSSANEELMPILKNISSVKDKYTNLINVEPPAEKFEIDSKYLHTFNLYVHGKIKLKQPETSPSKLDLIPFVPINYPDTLSKDIASYAFVGQLNANNQDMINHMNGSLDQLNSLLKPGVVQQGISATNKFFKNRKTAKQLSYLKKSKAVTGLKEAPLSNTFIGRTLGYRVGDKSIFGRWGGTRRKRQLQASRV